MREGGRRGVGEHSLLRGSLLVDSCSDRGASRRFIIGETREGGRGGGD